jgi:hypothetical protein
LVWRSSALLSRKRRKAYSVIIGTRGTRGIWCVWRRSFRIGSIFKSLLDVWRRILRRGSLRSMSSFTILADVCKSLLDVWRRILKRGILRRGSSFTILADVCTRGSLRSVI